MQFKKHGKMVKSLEELKTYNSYLTIRSLTDIYNLIYYKLYQNTQGWINQEKDEKKISSFLLALHNTYGLSSVGSNWISQYLFFQFCYWYDKRTRYAMKLDWVIGKKALERYESATDENIWVCVERMDKLGVTTLTIKDLLIRQEKKEARIQKINPLIEERKIRIEKTSLLAYCQFNGLYYSSYSRVCLTCPSKLTCEKLNR